MKTNPLFAPVLPIIFGLLLSVSMKAQEASAAERAEERLEEREPEEAFHPHHVLGLVISHAQVREGAVEGGNKWLSLPSWGLNYNYHFSPRWAIGLHTDLITEEFLVERHLANGEEGEVIERRNPIAPALMATYKFGERPHSEWGIEFGVGGEFAGGESFFLTRIGIEYAVEIRNHWEFFGGIAYDIKWNGYDSFVFGLGIAKAFGLPHEVHEPASSRRH